MFGGKRFMDDTNWVILDTETDGLVDPIHVVEIAAQLMCGWEPCGDPFQVFLNHDVVIPSAAVAIHGYTQEFLRKHGRPPAEAHESFRKYGKDYPIVAHNLGYDWNRALVPEWTRLGLNPIGRRGFCTLALSRRVLAESADYRLTTLRWLYGLNDGPSHKALSDVATVVQLFREVLVPRLKSAGLISFESWEHFSRRTPLSACWQRLDPTTEIKSRRQVTDAWDRAGTLWWAIDGSGRYCHAWCKRMDLHQVLLKIDPVHWNGDLDCVLPILLANMPAEISEREKATRLMQAVGVTTGHGT